MVIMGDIVQDVDHDDGRSDEGGGKWSKKEF